MCDEVLSETNWSFDRVVALGFYDGPTEGLLLRGHCAYAFATVADDVDRELRIVTLARVGEAMFERVVDILTQEVGAPRWPVWVPLWKFNSSNVQERVEAELDAIVKTGRVVAAGVFDDSLVNCKALKMFNSDEYSGVRDWFALFDMPKA